MIIYGIKNCDTMQKAFKFLAKKKISYVFHDYKEKGIDKATIKNWMNHFPLNKVININSTTYKSLSPEEKNCINDKTRAIRLIMLNNSMIKRPFVDLENGKYLLGFKENDWIEALNL